MEVEDSRETCVGCSVFLSVPYIQCAQCGPPSVHLCLYCFSRGLQTQTHTNDHSYYIIKDDFELLGGGWTAHEEEKLLTGISNYGIGNWSEVAQHVETKSKSQCETHYETWYVNNKSHQLIDFPDPDIDYGTPPVTYRATEEPPRPLDDSPLQLEMSGYTAARGDFILHYDNFAELDVKEIDFDSVRMRPEIGATETELKLAVIDVYLNRLRERHQRKKIVRDYGLINVKKVLACNRPYERAFGAKFESLKALCRLLPPSEYDKYLESLLFEQDLRADIRRLQEYRVQGITSLTSGHVYDKLKLGQDENKQKRNLLSDVITHVKDEAACQQWLHRQAVLETISRGIPVPLPNPPRRSAPPLDIDSLPGHEKLSEAEKELCSLVRLVPQAYLEFRDLLVTESTKHGYLRLAQARNLIKIDVNKTRKIYDFLITEGLVRKDAA